MSQRPLIPGSWGASIDGESIPMTMHAEVEHMTIDEAIASGEFDLPDEPGMVRIPVTINMMIPNSVLSPPLSPVAPKPPPGSGSGVPPGSGDGPARRRFGTYPKRIATQRVMQRIRSVILADPQEALPGIVPGFGNARPAAMSLGTAVAEAGDGSGGAVFTGGTRPGGRALAAALGGAPARVLAPVLTRQSEPVSKADAADPDLAPGVEQVAWAPGIVEPGVGFGAGQVVKAEPRSLVPSHAGHQTTGKSEDLHTRENVHDLASVASEARGVNETAQAIVGWTVVNRMKQQKLKRVSEV